MERSVFNQMEKLITLKENLECQIGDFVEVNFKEVLKEIIKDGKDVEESEEGEYFIYLNEKHTVIYDGEAYEAYNIVYDTKEDEVYLEVDKMQDYLEFSLIEPAQQLEIIYNIVVEKFF